MKRTAMNLVLGAAPLTGIACDSTVALDPTQPSLTTVYVSGVCRAEASDQLDLSVVLLNQGGDKDASASLLPKTRVRRTFSDVETLLQGSAIRFNLPQIATTDAPGVTTSAFAAKDSAPNETSPLTVEFNRVDFEYAGGEAAQDLDPYIVLLMDQSASLIGRASESEVDTAKATDRQDQRIAFFKQVILGLPDNYRVTVMGFKESFADDSEQSNQTLPVASSNLPRRLGDAVDGRVNRGDAVDGRVYRDVVNDYLQSLTIKNDLKVGTPLTKALETAYDLTAESVARLRPTVVLFTDGVETGDSSSEIKTPQALSEPYKTLGVPVHVVHLQPPVTEAAERRGRSADLAELACATGGDYLFVQTASEFTESNRLEPILVNRLIGRWVLNVKTTLEDNARFPAGAGYLISTDISVTLGKDTRVFSASRSLDGATANDQRLWVYKP